MATYVQGIQTSVGVVKYDYNYLANLLNQMQHYLNRENLLMLLL